MARALVVGCGCRSRELGRRLIADGWSVRGTTRDRRRGEAIEAAGIEARVADPERPGTLLDLVADVTVIHWLLGSARGDPETLAAIHGPRLSALLERLVDTPVRGFVYEAAGAVPRQRLQQGASIVRAAPRTWRIPVEVVDADPKDHPAWLDAMTAASRRLIDRPRRSA
jgi:hypothetical protein